MHVNERCESRRTHCRIMWSNRQLLVLKVAACTWHSEKVCSSADRQKWVSTELDCTSGKCDRTVALEKKRSLQSYFFFSLFIPLIISWPPQPSTPEPQIGDHWTRLTCDYKSQEQNLQLTATGQICGLGNQRLHALKWAVPLCSSSISHTEQRNSFITFSASLGFVCIKHFHLQLFLL